MKSTIQLTMATLALAGSFGLAIDPASSAPHQLIAGKTKVMHAKIERDVVMADALMLKGKYSDAADLYRQAVSRNSKNVPAIVGLGMALGKQFKLDGAEEQFDKALALDSGNAMAHAGKAMVILNRMQSSSTTFTKNRDASLKQAESECQRAISIDPGMPEAHYNLGMVYKEEGRLDDASSEFNAAIKNDPKYSEAYSGLGMTKLSQNNYGEAVSAFQQAVTLNSGNSSAHYGLGRAYLQQGRVDDAIKELNTSLYQFPNSAPVHQALGEAYQTQGNSVAAVSEFQKSIGIKPESPDAYMHIADIREQRGDLEMSIGELRSGLAIMPNNADLHQRIGDESLRLEKLDDAITEYKTLLDQNPQDAAAAKGLVRGYYLKAQKNATGAFVLSNDYESADKYIQQAINLNPNDMELRLAQAKLKAMSGQTIDLSTIGTPTNDGERVAYAEALLAQDKFADASTQMVTVINNARDAKQTFAVADLALMIHDLNDADRAYKKAAAFPDGQDRAKRGQDLVAKARDAARQDLTMADDLARKKQLASAIDKYHSAISGNPTVSSARIGLANTLERLSPAGAADLKEAAVQLRAYVALEPDMPQKEKDKFQKRIDNDENKAYKLASKAKAQAGN